ncbi:MAG: hypothetical protein AAFY02_09500 [Pseudomonadota bacterium]
MGGWEPGALLAEIVLGVLVLEALWLYLRHRQGKPGPSPAGILRLVVPGFFLVLALRAALTDAAWPWIGLCLALGGLAHLVDLRHRLVRER